MLICILPAPESLYKTGNTNHIVISLRKLYAKRQNIMRSRYLYYLLICDLCDVQVALQDRVYTRI